VPIRRLAARDLRPATRETPRAINQQIVLGLLRSHHGMSRAELARRLGLQRSAVGRIVSNLIARGLVWEGPARPTARGRPSTLLHLDSRERCAVAVDVRVTRTHLAVTDLVGREISPVRSFPTDRDPRDFVAHLGQEVRRRLAENRAAGRCQGVGVAFPGMLDRSGDVVVHAPALGWRNVALREPLAARLGLPVVMENAVKAWALAQVWALRGEPRAGDMVFVNVSDGVGVGVVIGGEVLRGRHNVAGEFGHLPLSVDGPRCACGATGCWEAYVSNLATLARYVGRSLEPGQPVPPEVARLTVDDVVARARGGDARALAALLTTAHYLGLGLASIVNALDPERVYIGGEISAAWDLLEPTVRAALAQRTLVAVAADVNVVVVAAREHPRLRGAAALVGAPILGAQPVA
jgi:predicted NBD/HSP70 family sugar kinase